ncbi:cold-responsive protein kinase 1-like [Amaranthus tricolor]|uniref:cold-responsive protein kinase 1-like n=1 Tax=Amaranthus tricolor TaxID=29722 RepID=UPI0025846C76|nr:cold-responsive protein kinase 1-like [Amaranthus tricolor]
MSYGLALIVLGLFQILIDDGSIKNSDLIELKFEVEERSSSKTLTKLYYYYLAHPLLSPIHHIEHRLKTLITWEHYQKNELVALIDDTLEGKYDVEEACKFLKVGLLCTQDAPKLRPSMSTVVKMLTGVVSIDEMKITAPGLISDLSELVVRNPRDPKTVFTDSSDSMNNSTFSSGASTSATLTFTAVYERSI